MNHVINLDVANKFLVEFITVINRVLKITRLIFLLVVTSNMNIGFMYDYFIWLSFGWYL